MTSTKTVIKTSVARLRKYSGSTFIPIATASVLVVGAAWLAVAPIAQAKPPPSEDRGNGNSAAENVDALNLSTSGSNNTAHGWSSLFSNTTGSSNTADGFQALYSNTQGIDNAAYGYQALYSNSGLGFLGSYNTAIGSQALYSNTSGLFQTAVGYQALFHSNSGGNTAIGVQALYNSQGGFNAAVGEQALFSNTTGDGNVAVGDEALYGNTTGELNVAIGELALPGNTTGSANIAIGSNALFYNRTGDSNTAIGVVALWRNTTGSSNTGVGESALHGGDDGITGNGNTAGGAFALSGDTTGNNNTASGYNALFNNTTGDRNTGIGYEALYNNSSGVDNTAVGPFALFNNTGANNAAFGAAAGVNVATASNVICIGTGGRDVNNSCFIGHIRGVTTANADAVPVLIDSQGQLGTASSSRRFKKEIQPMDKASEAILALSPVTFHYKSDTTNTAQFGLIAEEVAEVNADLVVRDAEGGIYTVRYDAVNAMLLNEFLKEHRKVQDLEKGMAAVTAQLKEQAAQIQKVSAHLEMSKPATNVVLNNP
jgi:hypothetical protein